MDLDPPPAFNRHAYGPLTLRATQLNAIYDFMLTHDKNRRYAQLNDYCTHPLLSPQAIFKGVWNRNNIVSRSLDRAK